MTVIKTIQRPIVIRTSPQGPPGPEGPQGPAGGSTDLTTKGDVLSHDGSDAVRVPVGTDGQVLEADSGATEGVAWKTRPAPTPLTAKGDVLSHDGATTKAVPVGTDGQVLTANSAATDGVDWQDPSGLDDHAMGAAEHLADTLAALNSKVNDATLDDSSAPRTPTSHALAGPEHSASTLAEVNAKVSDATLDDASALRNPTVHGLAGADHSDATLAELNAKVSDATLDDAGDPRTPTTHSLGGPEHSSTTIAGLNAKLTDGDVDVVGTPRPPLNHDFAGATHVPTSLAALNTKITDGTVDDVSGSRTPSGGAGGDLGGTYPSPTVNDGADGTAIHSNIADEFNPIAAEGSPAADDYLIMERRIGGAKAKVELQNLPSTGGAAHDLGGAQHNADTLANLNSKVNDATLDDSGDARPPLSHALGTAHSADTLANLNAKVNDATLDDSGDSRPPLAHAFAGVEHTASTLANVNTKISDATIDDASDPRTPTAHALAGPEHTSSTLAALNIKVSDATLDQTGDSRPPDAHPFAGGDHTSSTLAQVNALISDATLDTSTAARPPQAHTHAHSDTTGQTADDHHNQQHAITSVGDHTFPGGATVYLDGTGAYSTPATGTAPHDMGGAQHIADTLANLNSKVLDATLDDSGDPRTPLAHSLGGAEHTSTTLGTLNGLITDANLDDSGDSRPPTAHSHAHADTTGQTADDHHNQVHALGGADHTASTLAALNALISDATLDDAGSPRPPTAHSHAHADTTGITANDHHSQMHQFAGADHISNTLLQVNQKISDATIDDSSAARPPLAHTHAHGDLTGTTENDHHSKTHGIIDGAHHTFPGGGINDFLNADGTFKPPLGGTAAGVQGFIFLFDANTTASDPGPGNMRFNAGTYAGTTALYYNDKAFFPEFDIGAGFETIQAGDLISIADQATANKAAVYTVVSATDNTGWWTLAVTLQQEAGGALIDDAAPVWVDTFRIQVRAHNLDAHGPSTIAELNAIISDANVDDDGDPRPPLPHTHAHIDTTGQTANDHHNQVHAFAGADHTPSTLAEVNTKVSDATLDDSGDPRPPLAHTHAHADTTGQTENDHHNRLHDATSGLDHNFPGGTENFLRSDGTFAPIIPNLVASGPETQDALVVFDPATATHGVKEGNDGAPVLFSDLYHHDGGVPMSGNVNLDGHSILAPVNIPTATSDAAELLTLDNTGTNPGRTTFRAGDRNPFGVVTGGPGDIYVKSDGIDSSLYINDGDGASNTTWADAGSIRGLARHTGLREGGQVTTASATTVNIAAGSGVILDTWTDPNNPIPKRVVWPEKLGVTLVNIATADSTSLGFDTAGALVQIPNNISNFDLRRYVIIGGSEHPNNTSIALSVSIGAPVYDDLTFFDYIFDLGVQSVAGNDVSEATIAPLGLDVSSGRMFFPDIGRDGTMAGRQDPHHRNQLLATDATWTSFYDDGADRTIENSAATDVDTARYNFGGALVNMTGGNWKADVVYRLPGGQLALQYGIEQFSTASAAQDSLPTIPKLLGKLWVPLYAVIVQRNATDLTAARFIPLTAGLGAGGGGGAGTYTGPAGGVSAGELHAFADSTGNQGQGTGIQAANVLLADATVDVTAPLTGVDAVNPLHYTTKQQLDAAASPRGTVGMVVTVPHSIRNNAAAHPMVEADGTIDRLDVTVPVPTEGFSGSFTFEVETGPSGGPYIPVGTVTVLQGATSGTAVINPVHAYAGNDVFVVNETAVGVMPGGTPSWNARFTIMARTTNT